ncbi:MAG: MaoC family dehydratase [Pseudomonadota bacterium]
MTNPSDVKLSGETIDLSALKQRVGDVIGVSDWILVDQAKISAFAELTGDPQFIHVDPARARAETPFGGTIAHGFLLLSLVTQMRANAVPPIVGIAMGINYGFERVRFISPVPSGSRVRGRFTLAALEARGPNEVQLAWGVSVDVSGAHKPALVAEWLTRAILKPERTS